MPTRRTRDTCLLIGYTMATANKTTPTRAKKDAARATKKAAAVVAVRSDAVGALIAQAGQAAQSMYNTAREAALAASKQLNPAKPLKERIAEVLSLYVKDLNDAGPNVKSVFGDVLTLQACAQTPVVVAVPGKDGKAVDTSMTASEAAQASKHAMRDAASQVRAAHNIGRKAGGGRKAAAPKPVESSKAKQPDTVKASDVDAFTAWLDALPDYLSDAVYHPRIVARMIESGWSLSRAAKGRKVAGKAQA
jgi:hypothetical protein